MERLVDILFGGSSSPLLIAMLFTVSAVACVSQYTAIGAAGLGPNFWRAFTAIGWTLLMIRFGFSYLTGVMPTLPPVASLSVIVIGIGAILRNVVDSSCYYGQERRRNGHPLTQQ